ncbi:MAG: hypothetical protein BRC32_03250 [Actinobacteria bacterium QS_8_72_14]|nr:MAG: hypothetical protein BRC32_03250 [Actinobacteria bacterium QS_8_72_14]
MSDLQPPPFQRARPRRGVGVAVGLACLVGVTACASDTTAAPPHDSSGEAAAVSGEAPATSRGGPPPATLAGAGQDRPSGHPAGAGAPRTTAEGAPLPLKEGADASQKFPAVRTRQPTVRLTGEAAGQSPVRAALDVDGVSFATGVRVGTLPVAVSGGPTTIEVAAVTPHAFRVVTPEVTAKSTDVWKRLVEGDMAVLHKTGKELDVELGDRMPAGGDGARLRVGAFASNGIPPVAEAIVSRETAETVGLQGRLQVLVSLDEDADGDAVARRLADATGLEPEPIEVPATLRADQQATGHSATDLPAQSPQIRPFSYQSIGDGMIRIDPGWVRRNIVSADVPVLSGPVTCHRAMIPQLRAALEEIRQRGLHELIRPGDFGGCWTPRHILFDPRRNLSMHAWGLAVDINVSTNAYGAQPQLDPRIVEVFKKWGFAWGGEWSTPDGMHFELQTLIDGSG